MSETVLLKDLFNKKLREQWYTKSREGSRNKKFRHNYDTGFLNVSTVYCQNCKDKMVYQYKWYDNERKKTRYTSSINLLALKEKVLKMGFEWKVINHQDAVKTARKVGLPLLDLK